MVFHGGNNGRQQESWEARATKTTQQDKRRETENTMQGDPATDDWTQQERGAKDNMQADRVANNTTRGGAVNTRQRAGQQYKVDRRTSLAVDHMTRGGVSQCKVHSLQDCLLPSRIDIIKDDLMLLYILHLQLTR